MYIYSRFVVVFTIIFFFCKNLPLHPINVNVCNNSQKRLVLISLKASIYTYKFQFSSIWNGKNSKQKICMYKKISFHYIFISLEPSASAIVCICILHLCIMYVHYYLVCDRNQVSVSGTATKVQFQYPKLFFSFFPTWK